MIKRALISVYNKEGLASFVKRLQAKGIKIISAGDTTTFLRKNQVKTVDVSEYVGDDTSDDSASVYNPKIFGGILARRDDPEDMKAAEDHGINMIDLVIVNIQPFVNLYPFRKFSEERSIILKEAFEQIDVSGHSLLRSAAKNFEDVTVVVDPNDYEQVAIEIETSGETSKGLRREMAEKIFELTSFYKGSIADVANEGETTHISVEKVEDLLYGENPHQKASFYKNRDSKVDYSVFLSKKIQGKPLSYNNILDANAGLLMVRQFDCSAAAFIKHENPCGIGMGESLEEAFDKGFDAEPRSMTFEVIVAMNDVCTGNIAKKIVGQSFDVVLSAGFEPEALKIFQTKPNLRVLEIPKPGPLVPEVRFRHFYGGALLQDLDLKELTKADLTCMTQKKPDKHQIVDLLFAWHTAKYAKSSAIVVAKGGQTVGIGTGQMHPMDALALAFKKSKGREEGAVLASDDFIRSVDYLEQMADKKITAIIQPGGGDHDKEIIESANQHGIAMMFTGVRALLH